MKYIHSTNLSDRLRFLRNLPPQLISSKLKVKQPTVRVAANHNLPFFHSCLDDDGFRIFGGSWILVGYVADNFFECRSS